MKAKVKIQNAKFFLRRWVCFKGVRKPRAVPFILILWLMGLISISCQDPFDFQPGDPTKPDPPAAPVLVRPADGEFIPNYAYPQDVEFEWQHISGATAYQYECYNDSSLNAASLVYSNPRITTNITSVRFTRYGIYYWRVRAVSPNWNNYTAWSRPFKFLLPNPAD